MSARTFCLALLVLACACLTSTRAFSLQVYNDSACTVSLPNYSYSNPQLNMTTEAPVCVNGSLPGSQPVAKSFAYQCAYSTTRPLVNLNLVSYTQTGCGDSDFSWVVYFPGNQTTGQSGGPQYTCALMTLWASDDSITDVYGVVACVSTRRRFRLERSLRE